ncbi:MAG: hypothetical protein JNL61_13740 [Rhizobiaceae bacterium]|nr:hypothetical protein [Rhizobiaceae bacterium]
MSSAQQAADTAAPSVDLAILRKLGWALLGVVLLSAAISGAGLWLGRSLSMGGHTDDRTNYEVVIGNDVIVAPANMIRFDRARRNGVAARLDVYMRWPDLTGYDETARDDFNHAGGSRNILFLSFEERMISRDMSGRFDPIYRSLILWPGVEGPAGLRLFPFKPNTGYVNEELAVANRPGQDPFVARCLVGQAAEDSLAPCERDVHVGEGLSLSYRFPRDLLPVWRELDEAVGAKAALMLTGSSRH